jgi:hypothetical protein
MKLDNLTIDRNAYSSRLNANSYLGMSQNAKKLGLKEEQTIEKNESRYDLDGTLKEEHLPIGSKERARKKEEEAEKLGLKQKSDKDDKEKTDKADSKDKLLKLGETEKTDGKNLSENVHDKEKDDEKGLFGLKRDGFLKDPPDCECETCRKRRYQDDSDDSSVSFQVPTNMSPEAAKVKVRGHEMEHVRRESIKAKAEGKKVVSQTVRILTNTCNECGRIYVSGGLTRTVTRIDMRDFHRMFMLGFDTDEDKFGT